MKLFLKGGLVTFSSLLMRVTINTLNYSLSHTHTHTRKLVVISVSVQLSFHFSPSLCLSSIKMIVFLCLIVEREAQTSCLLFLELLISV